MTSVDEGRIKDLSSFIVDVSDFPKEGVMFKDISPLLADKEKMKDAVWYMKTMVPVPDYYVGMDARGFVFAAPMAYTSAEAGLVMCRKKGKLPGKCIEESYDLEYGSATIEIEESLMKSGSKVVIVDDVLATGGTALAAANLCKKLGVEVTAVVVLMELTFLGGREKLESEGFRVESLIKY